MINNGDWGLGIGDLAQSPIPIFSFNYIFILSNNFINTYENLIYIFNYLIF